ncbi:MAG: hypothetical protein GX311_05595 [Bacteroidales bacterium]|jgi:hypothetical protein|nr:hypothetical protein [Bacteroidales bacterium]
MRKYILFLLIFITINVKLSAQLTVISPDTVIVTNYSPEAEQDSIYVFYGPGQGGWDLKMKATGRDINNLSSTFTWSELKVDVDGFWDTLQIDQNETVSEFTTTNSGVYKLQVTNSQTDTIYYFALFADNMRAKLFYRPDCDELKVQGILTTEQFRYLNRHILPHVETVLNNKVRYNWQIDFLDPTYDDAWIPDTVQRTFTPPFAPRIVPIPREQEHYRIIVQISDTLGHYAVDTMIYQSISVEADFVASIDGEDKPESEINIKGQAPFKVQFKNLSKNAVSYEWSLWHRTESLSNRPDTVWRRFHNFEPLDSIVYVDAGSYTVKLKATGRSFFTSDTEKACVSVDSILNYITVYNSALGELPNVFTPSGDGVNDVFTFKDKENTTGSGDNTMEGTRSIKRLEVYIYSRAGDKVYEYIGDDDDWEGWDGRRMGHGLMVQPGVYFYIVLGEGWDGHKHKASGFVHVYR